MGREFDRSVLTGLALLAALVAVNAGVSYHHTRKIHDDATWVAHTQEVLAALGLLRADLRDLEATQRTFVLAPDDRIRDERTEEPFRRAASRTRDRLTRLARLTSDNPAQQSRFAGLDEDVRKATDALNATMLIRRDRGLEAARAVIAAGDSHPLDATDRTIAEIERAEHELLGARGRETDRAYSSAVLFGAASAGFGLVAVALFVLLLRRSIRLRTRAATLIHEQREWFRTTLGSIGDAVIATDTAGRVTFLNPVAEALTGWASADAAGRALTEVFQIVNEATRAPVENPAFRALRDGVIVGLANHTVLIARDGTERPIDDSAAPIRDEAGAVGGAVLVFRDITERKKSEAAFQESRERLTSALRMARMCTWDWDPESDRLSTSDTAAEVFGLSPGEELESGQYGFGLIHPDDAARHRETVRRSAERGANWHTEFRIVRPRDGQVAWLEERATARRDPDTGAAQMTGLVWDVTERKRAEEERTRLAETLELAVAAADLGFWVWDPGTDLITLSKRAAEMYGVDPDRPYSREWMRRFVHPDDRDRARDEAARAVAERSDYDVEYRLDRPGPVWVAARGRGVFDAAGALTRMLGVVQDVTARKRTESELRDIRSRMESALAAGAIGTWSWDVPADRFHGDPSLAQIFSLPPDVVAGGPISRIIDAIHPDDRARVGALVTRAVESGGRYEADYRVTGRDGSWRWVAARGQVERDADGRSVRFPGVVIDVTERKCAEEALVRLTEQSERRRRLYETALSNTPDLVYVFDLDHRFTYANEALLKMWGRSWDEAIGRTCLELGYEGWHASMHDREIEQVRATKRPIRGEVPFTGTTGRRVYDYIFVPVLGADGEVEAVAGTTRDITDRQAMEQELREADRKKDDFIAMLAHELRNPLAPIRNGLQVMRLAGGDPDALARARATMDRQLTHMVRLIDDLLDISRINRNKMELRRTRSSLTEIVASAVETARPLTDEAGHELTVALPAAPVYLDADLTRLSQVFSNLLTNSAKYTPPGGRIWLSADRGEGAVAVSVRDTGIGIPAASLGNIFDMFSQVDRSVERSTGGLGIGLALVRGLVEMHGGKVTAASEGEGRGSTFTVTLPVLSDPAPAPCEASDPVPTATGSGRRVLVVDDNRDGAESMAEMLLLLGNDVRTAHDGLEAVAECEAFRPDVILMDIGMPRLNGLDATRRIRERPWGKGITIIALTGWGQDGDRERSRGAGCDGHLVKPVSLSDLEKLLVELKETT